MSEENKNNEGLNEGLNVPLFNTKLTPETPEFLPEADLTPKQTIGDGIEVISDEPEAKQEFDLTVEELKKLLRIKMKKEDEFPLPVTDEMVDELTEEEIGELKEVAKIRDRKALLRFVNHTKNVTDEEAKNLTDEEFLDLTNKALVMSRFLNYNTKKDFGVKYKKKRQNRNKMAKRQRAINRK